jgi:shikimate dehydrogenase
MTIAISGRTQVAGVVGRPIDHSLSPTLHNAWITAAGIDAVYVAFAPAADGLARLVEGLRGGALRGLNITAPFKEAALAAADRASHRAAAAGAANLLIFEADGSIRADNTDGEGLMAALAEQAPGFNPAAGPLTLLGAGGAARAAAAAFLAAGAPAVRVVNRSAPRAEVLAALLGPRARATPWDEAAGAIGGANAIVNATPGDPGLSLEGAPTTATVVDMVYRPLDTALLRQARARGLRAVDGLAMLIGQARPSFTLLFGRSPPAIDARRLALAALEGDR